MNIGRLGTMGRGSLALASLTIMGIVALTLAGVAAAFDFGPMVTPPGPQTAVEGVSQTFSLGSFDESPTSNLWDVDVNWGDGSPLTILLATAPGSLGAGFHTFGEEASYTVSVTVINDATSSMGSAQFTVTNADPPVIGTGVNVSGVEGAQFTGNVATFIDPGGAEPNPFDPSGIHYTATINWGDGSPLSTGGIGGPDVYGSHTYATGGPFTITTDINHEGMITETRSTANIAAVPEPATLVLLSIGIAGLGFSRRRKRT